MKNLMLFSLRLFLTQVATCAVAFISMMMILAADIAFLYKVLAGLLFAAFHLFMTGNNAFVRGRDEEKNHTADPARGFWAGLIAMIPAITLTIVYMVIAWHGWEKGVRAAADGVYVILYLIFLAYSPLLSTFVAFNPALNVDFAQPAITFLKNITTPNAVSAPLFFLPIVLTILVSGAAYLSGRASQRALHAKVEKLKEMSKKQTNS